MAKRKVALTINHKFIMLWAFPSYTHIQSDRLENIEMRCLDSWDFRIQIILVKCRDGNNDNFYLMLSPPDSCQKMPCC